MKRLKIFLFAASITSLLFACQQNQKATQKTGQENGLNTIDSTKSQTSGEIAPGTPPDSSNVYNNTDSDLAAPPTNQAPASGNARP